MEIRTVIIDDEPIALEKLKSYVAKVPFLKLVGEFSSAVEAAAFINEGNADVIFTDISMPDLDGMQLVETLANAPMVVFITAHPQYAVDSYRLSAVDYLLKPYGFADFQRAANKVLENWRARSHSGESERAVRPDRDSSLFVKVDYKYLRVSLSDIRYVKGYGEYLQIYLSGQTKPLITLSSFAAIREKLSPNFLQIHRSYIVNMDQVERIEKSRVVMDADTYIPVGDSYKSTFLDYLARHSAGSRLPKD